jgi:DHA1 family bicyclomycin/chloramphenicol resistance-like MFS transporter
MSPPVLAASVVIVAALIALGPLSTDMYLPAFPQLAQYFDASIDQVQLTLSVFLIGFALAQLLHGPLSDRLGRKPVMLGALLLFVLASCGVAAAASIEAVTVWRLLQAFGGAAGPVLGRAMVRDRYGPAEAARMLAYIGSAMALAPALAPILGGYLGVWFGWQAIFLFLALYGLVGALLLALKVPETLSAEYRRGLPRGRLWHGYRLVWAHRRWRWYAWICSFVFCGLFAFLSGASFVIIDHFGWPEERFGWFFALVVFGFMVGGFTAGRCSRRFGVDRLILFGAGLAAVAGSVMCALAWLRVDTVAAVVAPMIFYMAAAGIVMPQAMAGAMAPFAQHAGAASALLGFVQMSLAAATGVLVGHLHDGSPLSMATAIALSGLLTLAACLGLWRRADKPC